MKRTYRVYGFDGHRNRISFMQSFRIVCSDCTISVNCSDITGTNDYVDVEIEALNEWLCVRAILAQESDGIFENSRTGSIIDLATGAEITFDLCNELAAKADGLRYFAAIGIDGCGIDCDIWEYDNAQAAISKAAEEYSDLSRRIDNAHDYMEQRDLLERYVVAYVEDHDDEIVEIYRSR